MAGPLPPPPPDAKRKAEDKARKEKEWGQEDPPIATWTYCKICEKVSNWWIVDSFVNS